MTEARASRRERRLLIDLCLQAGEAEPASGADTAVLAALAARLNVESYILESLGPHQPRLGPAALRWLADLRQKVFAVAVENLRRDAELGDALGRLQDEEIPFILLKGSALRAETPGLAGRFQCDVDVLLRWEDLRRAEAVLRDLGFVLDESYLGRQGLLTDHFHLAYQRRGATVELHWDIDVTSPPGFTERLWERRRPVELEERTFQVLSPEHQLMVGCLHLSRHAFYAGLRWLADLRRLLPISGEVLDRFVEEARPWPCRAVYCPLWLLASWGVAGSKAFLDGFEVRAAERRLLDSLLMGEPWMGLPAWRVAKALHAWLFSDRSLLGLLSGVWGEGLRRLWVSPKQGVA